MLTAFGALWLYNAMLLGGASRTWFVAFCATATALLIASMACIREGYKAAGGLPRRPPGAARLFWMVFALEGAAILAVILLFQLWHAERYIVAAIAIIVGIHFLPLARLFRAPVYYLTGAALILWPLVLLGTMSATTRREVPIAYGAGAILWSTALLVIAFPRR